MNSRLTTDINRIARAPGGVMSHSPVVPLPIPTPPVSASPYVTTQSQQTMGQNTQVGLQAQGNPVAPANTTNVTNGTMAPSFFSETVAGIPVWMLGIGAVAVFFLMKGK